MIKYHNIIIGAIRVYCRVRPLLEDEDNEDVAFSFPSENSIVCSNITYQFDRVYQPFHNQGSLNFSLHSESVFKDLQPLVTSVLDGYSVCIFAYGTHTLLLTINPKDKLVQERLSQWRVPQMNQGFIIERLLIYLRKQTKEHFMTESLQN